MKHPTQNGFSILALILTILLFALLAFMGWRAYEIFQSQPTTPTPEEQTQVTEDPKPQYLVIKEWGVRIPLSDLIENATYTSSSQHAALSTPRLKELFGQNLSCSLVDMPIAIRRVRLGELKGPEFSPPYTEADVVGWVKIDDYYYHYSQMPLCKDNAAPDKANEVNNIQAALRQAIESIEAAQ